MDAAKVRMTDVLSRRSVSIARSLGDNARKENLQ